MADSPFITIATGADFAQRVLETSRQHPVLVDFWAGWCAPCRQLMPVLEKLANEFQGQFLLVKVDTDAEQALAGQCKIRSLPTVQLFKDGQVVDQFLGALPEVQVRAFIEKHLPRAAEQLLVEARRHLVKSDLSTAAELIEQARALDAQAKNLFITELQLKLAAGDYDTANLMLEHTPLDLVNAPEVLTARGQLHFAAIVKDTPMADVLETHIETHPDDSLAHYQLAAHLITTGQFATAIDRLLALMQKDRQFNDEAPRKALLMVFDMLGNHDERVAPARARMARLLF
ncbi:thioredoxin [Rhodoferax sp. 4810]|uniref:Thioredoxin n=1 Tax=Thiospirillum jenense TaxID=1653858 RepID=A0A839HEV9_9GAMM|nr:thioredoxin [Thiospirillum jenense]MBB1073365.1 thioredoxin [Rhodoferax jenense]MBB1125717.1 thioredoxin [Thiospirillum jenense]